MIKYYNLEELSEVVKYTIRATYLFGDDKVVVVTERKMSNMFGYDVLSSFASDEPDFIDYKCKYIKGKFIIDEDFEGVIQVLDDDSTVIEEFCDLEELQKHLVGVEIVKVEELEDE